jgi:predicted nucleotidyltransferase
MPECIQLPPFTYFKDSEDYIFYSGESYDLDKEYVRATLVYVPAPAQEADRYQPATKTTYIKFISHGYRSEMPRMMNGLSTRRYDYMTQFMNRDSITGDEFLSIPVSNICEVYNPKTSLNRILNEKTDELSDRSVDKVHAAINELQKVGIELGRLGLYGGLQCGLRQANSREINDIDILVDGCGAYAAVVNISSRNMVQPETFPRFVAENAVKRAVAMRRGQLSQFKLPDYTDTTVDIRLLRSQLSKYPEQTIGIKTIILHDAKVIDASESLSLPANYNLADSKGQILSLHSKQYHHLGAATVGDTVSVRGYQVDKTQILLSRPDTHYIYCNVST